MIALPALADQVINAAADPACPYGPIQQEILNDEAFARALAAVSSWPGYAPTPLVELAGLARQAGLARLAYKDEGARFGLGSFKALGGAYAVWQVLRRSAQAAGIAPDDADRMRLHAAGLTVCCATDGNHGRSVAWGARTFGSACVIFIHETVSEGRKAAIEAFGAQVVRTPGTYDDSVRQAQRRASEEGWVVVSDTSYPGYRDIPKDVMQGYEIMAHEALAQWEARWGADSPPTHVFLQTGVGGMAAAVAAHLWRRFGAARPVIVLADPDRAACWVESLRAGHPVPVHGALDTLMAGLACGEVSELAWEILRTAADGAVAVCDEAAVALMRLLAEGVDGDPALVAGESAVAGLAACLTISPLLSGASATAFGLTPQSRVLVFGTEGATDPELYHQIVGTPVPHQLAVSQNPEPLP